MIASRCARCNWIPEPGETLADHAEAAEHPLCSACNKSLPSDRPRVCRDCQDDASVKLDEILTMWGELPELLDAQASATLPGGDVLVLAGPGARGVQGAEDDDIPWWLGAGHIGPVTATEWRRRQDRTGARGEISDNRAADTPSVSWTLAVWADDWRHIRGEQPRPHAHGMDDEAAPAHADFVQATYAYLRDNAAWAAAEHWAWAEYFYDLKHLHAALQRATGRYRKPTRLNLNCFACNGPLQYEVISDAHGDPPPTRPRWWVDKHTFGPVDAAEYDRRHLGTAGLEEDVATCRDCRLRYDPSALLLAQRRAVDDAQWFEDEDGTRWGTVKAVADYVHRSQWTLRTWQRQSIVRSSQHYGAVYLHLDDVEAEVELRAPRQPRKQAG